VTDSRERLREALHEPFVCNGTFLCCQCGWEGRDPNEPWSRHVVDPTKVWTRPDGSVVAGYAPPGSSDPCCPKPKSAHDGAWAFGHEYHPGSRDSEP